MTDYLCEDLIVEISERLPIKTLIRFRSLSKSWCSCISSIVSIRIRDPQKVDVDHKGYIGYNEFEDKYNEVIASCNVKLSLRDLIDDENYICLFNFSLRRTLTLPNHSSLRDSISVVPNVAYGYGFDPITCDYKIVGICYSSTKGTIYTSFMYSMKTDTWTEIVSPTTNFCNVKSPACFVNGSLYWLVKHVLSESSTEPECFILTFNLSTHVFGKIFLEERRWKTTQIIIYNGSLSIAFIQGDDVLICAFKEYKNFSGWSYMTRLKRDVYDAIRGVKRRTNGDLSFNTYNIDLNFVELRPYCYGKAIFWEKYEEKKIIRLSLPSIPI